MQVPTYTYTYECVFRVSNIQRAYASFAEYSAGKFRNQRDSLIAVSRFMMSIARARKKKKRSRIVYTVTQEMSEYLKLD